ncbi:hypothetical protein ACFOWX_09340 [Sphingorhabdus arenilitoris]|uniref:Uncharacterized protein n=1 Tax=Sphingorhabdus arenilitoris TaxID=1490041 RepID=A0ABV8RH92_9SPHN
MEMNFPHLKENNDMPSARQDFRALISKAISRQGTSPTAVMMFAKSRDRSAQPVNNCDDMTQRIRYFAAALHPNNAATGPYGAFFPHDQTENMGPAIYDQAVYQDGLGNGKGGPLETGLSEEQAIFPGQEN